MVKNPKSLREEKLESNRRSHNYGPNNLIMSEPRNDKETLLK